MRILLLPPLLVLAGCANPAQKNVDASLKEAHLDPASAATISGMAMLHGPLPKPRKLDLSANPTCERQHLKPVMSEEVVTGRGGALRNVLVYVKSGLPPNLRFTAPTVSASLDQQGCVYQPHVLALMVGQTLEVSNSDPLNHNVHAEATVNAPFNVAEPPRAEKLIRTFDHQEIMIPVSCGVHPWMKAYISVVAHPFFAVTGEDGRFELPRLPPGNYVLEAVQERYGSQRIPVQVAAKGNANVSITFTTASDSTVAR